ncbi:MAG: amino acid permease [Quinella sp. 2Q5]|nr:amino acid permease [Quinella sp. 2Q5]
MAFGCCIGWGSFIMPGTTFLPTAGTAGTAVAIALGVPVMILFACNYHFVMQRISGEGGVFTFTREIFGRDHAFFCAWFLWIAYASLLWANATAVTLMGRNLFGGVLQRGFHYTFAGYDVYGGEVLVTLLLLMIFAVLFVKAAPLSKILVQVAAVGLLLGVIGCYLCAVNSAPEPPTFFFADNKSPTTQVFIILALAPWAFIGFETISQYTNEFPKNSRQTFVIMAAAIICAATVYILMTSLATLQFPAQFKSSAAYIRALDNLTGLWRVPTFFTVTETFGEIWILCAVISCALTTSMIGYYRAVGNLTQVFAREKIMPQCLATRRNAVLFVLATSLIVPFFGRTVIGWLTDVTTIGATIAYGYTCACAYVLARREKNRRAVIFAIAGIICAVAFTFFLLIPNLWSIDVLTQESYFILAIWGVIGFAYFNFIFKRDEKFFGTAPTVWLVLFFLIFFSGLMWMREKMYDDLTVFINETNKFYADNPNAPRFAYANKQIANMRTVLLNNSMILLMFAIAGLGFLFTIYRRIQQKEMLALEEEKRRAEESSRAKSTFLSNMSHDIRTPMNAIIGYTTLAQRDDVTYAELRDFMAKIDVSGKHLLDLINDILEMSRIESGRMELDLDDADLKKFFDDLQTMFRTQMETKGLSFTVDASGIRHRFVRCDRNRFNRVLLNLVGNAYKFTPRGKSVAVTLTEEDDGNFLLSVKDTGIGMSEEFAKKIFHAFERERTSTVSGIQGTGLGTAITKSIVELMGGTIDVVTAKDVGTEFIVRVAFDIVDPPAQIDEPEAHDEPTDFSGVKILLVEDIDVNREIAVMMLEQFGFAIDTAVNGSDALDKATANAYDLILMDVQMPVMNGYESARAMRQRGLKMPIVAMTANAMPEDIKRAYDSGMNDHIAKPLDMPKMMATITAVLKNF